MQELKQDILIYYRTQQQSLSLLKRSLQENNMLDDEIIGIKKQITPAKLIGVVEDYFETVIKIKSRKSNIIFARKAAAYILKKYTKLSLIEISQHIGVNDHSTVLYNIRKCRDLIDTEDWYAEKILSIEQEIDKYCLYLEKK